MSNSCTPLVPLPCSLAVIKLGMARRSLRNFPVNLEATNAEAVSDVTSMFTNKLQKENSWKIHWKRFVYLSKLVLRSIKVLYSFAALLIRWLKVLNLKLASESSGQLGKGHSSDTKVEGSRGRNGTGSSEFFCQLWGKDFREEGFRTYPCTQTWHVEDLGTVHPSFAQIDLVCWAMSRGQVTDKQEWSFHLK